MYIVKFRTMIFFEDVVSTSAPMLSEHVSAFVEKIKQAGFDVIDVYPVEDDDDDNDDYDYDIIIEEDIEEDIYI